MTNANNTNTNNTTTIDSNNRHRSRKPETQRRHTVSDCSNDLQIAQTTLTIN